MRDKQAAIVAVRRRMAELSLSIPRLAAKASVNEGTVRGFLAATSWPVMTTAGKLERALGWPPGRIEDIAMGISPDDGGESGEGEDQPAWSDPVNGDAGDQGVTLIFKGWRVTINPSPGATHEEVAKVDQEILADALARLRALGLDDGGDENGEGSVAGHGA